MGYIEIHWDTLGYIGIHWDILGCIGIHWDTLEYIGIHWDIFGCIGIHWDTLGYIGVCTFIVALQSELERKLSSVSRSKVHYKQQWNKALHELALTRQREQKSMRDKLVQQEREVNELKRSMQVASDTKVNGCVAEWVYV